MVLKNPIRAAVNAPYWSIVKHSILLVEDNIADVELVRRSLSTGPGAPQLIVADDGVEALRILRQKPAALPLPDLILLDLNLPRQTGLQILAELKSDPALKQIPVVVLTSSNAERDVSSAYGLHANCYFAKPMDIDGFAEMLRSIEEFWFSRVILPAHTKTTGSSNTKTAPAPEVSR